MMGDFFTAFLKAVFLCYVLPVSAALLGLVMLIVWHWVDFSPRWFLVPVVLFVAGAFNWLRMRCR